MSKGGKGFLWAVVLMMCLTIFRRECLQVQGAEEEKIEFFYENVCASCKGDADFFTLYEECLTSEERQFLQGRVITYNVFLDSCREYYEERRESLGIPAGTYLPVLIANGSWVSGLDQMEELLHEAASAAAGSAGEGIAGAPANGEAANAGSAANGEVLNAGSAANSEAADAGITDQQAEEENAERAEELALINRLRRELEDNPAPAVLLFTTEACDDCSRAEQWLSSIQEENGGRVLICNIIRDPSVNFLRALLKGYGVEEQDQKVPALFYGESALTGADNIMEQSGQELWNPEGTEKLLAGIDRAQEELESRSGREAESGKTGLLTLAGAGLLAGLNPCSISMLLMLLSMIVAEKASVWKNGLLYLGGKYAAYLSIGLIIFISASELEEGILQSAGQLLNRVLALLFILAGILYLSDAVRVFRQDYGKIRTQLPGKLRKWNHALIRRAGSYSGVLKPLLILGLGMAISVGEFFCTGQIYMASITYLLRQQVSGVWLYFMVYVTSMSLPAFLMLMIIQRTRNTEHISEFMLRHLGAVKIFNALLFFAFAFFFLQR